jgi:hypothetical protein
MAKRIAFLAALTRIIPVFLALICLLAPAVAQHGGGGGHSAGGHSGGGHSRSGHASGGHFGGNQSPGRYTGEGHTGRGHFGWLHLGSGNRARRVGGGTAGIPNTPRHLPPETGRGSISVSARPMVPTKPVPPRSFWFSVLSSSGSVDNRSFLSSGFRHHRGFPLGRFPCSRTSGCFFNGLTQVCFFEPVFRLLFFEAGFDFVSSEFGGADNSLAVNDDDNSLDTTQPQIAANAATAVPLDAERAAPTGENSPLEAEEAVDNWAEAADEAAANGLFLLVLKDGGSRAVADYWFTSEYLEYTGSDRTRSHIPIEALDLQKTVAENSRHGRPFVIQSAPMNTH